MNAEERASRRLKLVEDHIGRSLAESEQNGELRTAPSFGKPLNFGDGYDETPAEFRMGYKILKDAGVVPPEVELMQQIAALSQSLQSLAEGDALRSGRQRLSEMRQQLALRLEKLRASGSL